MFGNAATAKRVPPEFSKDAGQALSCKNISICCQRNAKDSNPNPKTFKPNFSPLQLNF